MKKPLAIALLVICNAAVVLVMTVVNLVLFFMTFSLAAAILIGLAALAALGFASSRIFRLFRQKYGLRTRWFILASYVPSVIGTAVYCIIYAILYHAGYFTGNLAGLGEFILALSLVPTAVCYLISGTCWCSNTN
ncbi:MAG: hypothetical protein K2N56_07435 [Oscillospiraceae bacterium]|nr:hypothetical protein [Oscillospiraceae bacterium]